MYDEITLRMMYYGAVVGSHWSDIIIGFAVALVVCTPIVYFSQPRKHKAIMRLTRPLDSIEPGWYEVTFYGDNIKKLDA